MGLWTEDISVYYHDERLPLCGNMQFLKEFHAHSADGGEYEEGAAVNRRKVRLCLYFLHGYGVWDGMAWHGVA